MRKQFLVWSHFVGILVSFMLESAAFGAPCGGPTVLWHDLSDAGCSATSSGVTADVFDHNIDIIGTNALVDGIHVGALTCDILITITNSDAVITGSGNRCDDTPTNPARLYLFADTGRTITFQVGADLLFRGTSDQGSLVDLMVTVSGPGTVIFEVADATELKFGDNGLGTSGGTKFFLVMDPVEIPNVEFRRAPGTVFGAASVAIGTRSLISFIADPDSLVAAGHINFAPRDTGLDGFQALVLNIEDGGGVNIGAHALNASSNSAFFLTDINLATLVGNGATADFNVVDTLVTSTTSAGTIVIANQNNTGCVELFSNPFCKPDGYMGDGFQPGFVLLAPAAINVANNTYITYVGTSTNTCCEFTLPDDCGNPQTFRRLRNDSALIIDSLDGITPASINLTGTSAVFFLSAVDNCGNVDFIDFTLSDTGKLSKCQGNIVLAVESPLNVNGDPAGDNALNILSLQVVPTGCPLFVENGTSGPFPARTFARDAFGQYLRYNSAAFLINSRLNFFNAALLHTDENHQVYEEYNLGNTKLRSDPTYVGGDSYLFPCHAGEPRPTIAFYNGDLRLNTSAAATGVDFLVPNNPFGGDNISRLIFYNNGRCIDKGYGRNLILGTAPCFDQCITSTGEDAHLNVFQEIAQASPTLEQLHVLSHFNNSCITEGIVGDITNQYGVNTIYLNNASNISIGTNDIVGTDTAGGQFALTTTGEFIVDSPCISFETRGGNICFPQASGTTGQGGIFVDTLGRFAISDNFITNIGTMLTKSHNGVIDVPYNSTFFDPRVGITHWAINLAVPEERILVGPTDHFSDFTLDWGAVQKVYCCTTTETSTSCFVPFDIEAVFGPCLAPFPTQQNLFALPEVQGRVDQMQILRARICDPVHLKVNGGYIDELVFLQGFNSAEAPTGFIVLENNGVVGLGSAHRNVDSLEASIKLGVNGVMLVANGNGTVELNEDILIDNVCHILSGTAFGLPNGAPANQRLTISSTLPKELRIKSGGTLDLSQFDNANRILSIGGQVTLVAEPNSRIIMNGGNLEFTDDAVFLIDRVLDGNLLTGTVSPTDLDNARVILSGVGGISMRENARMFIPQGGYFSVETLPFCNLNTTIEWELLDQARIQIGTQDAPGGSFQIGNTVTQEAGNIDFFLTLQGQHALFQLDRSGFFGIGVGMVNNFSASDNEFIQNPNGWRVGCLSNIRTFSVAINEGTFQHNQILDGFDAEASLLAIGNTGSYTFFFDPASSTIRGGGNMVRVICEELPPTIAQAIPQSLIPTVTSFAGTDGFLETGIMAGKFILTDPSKGPQPAGDTAAGFFEYLSSDDYALTNYRRANFASDILNIGTLGYVRNGSLIVRENIQQGVLLTRDGQPTDFEHSLQIGAVDILIYPTNETAAGDLTEPVEIIGSGVE